MSTMKTSIPMTMKALVTQENKTASLRDIPVPSIDDDELLIQNVAVAQNPTDWQYIDRVTNVDTIVGCDFSGYVVKIGKDVTSISVGDKVAGFTQGGNYTDRGAYAEYSKASADLVWKIPDGTVTWEDAATMGCAFWTAIQGLFHPMRLGLVEIPHKVEREQWIFVYGGSSSVGMFAIQLAHLAGYQVVTTTSPKNFDLCKSLGADAIFDYKDPEVSSKIKAVTKDTLHHVFDTICTLQTQTLAMKTFAPGPGKLIVIQPPQPDAQILREDVQIDHVLIYTALGRDFVLFGKFYPAAPEDRVHMVQFLKKVPALVEKGLVKPNPVKLWEGGLASINDGLRYMKEGKNSGEKIVYRI
ncbi:zinc-containing alcohol dehydrogenase family protein [Abortiporus biennis]